LDHGRFAFLQAVEDELLLGLPQIPRNPALKEIELSTDGEVTPASEPGKEQLQQPFAGLADMLKEKTRD